MNLWVTQNPWRLMLAVNAAVLVGVFLHKIALPPFVPYIHLLVDYHYGFTKRALVGAIAEVWELKKRDDLDQGMFRASIARAASFMSQEPRRSHW